MFNCLGMFNIRTFVCLLGCLNLAMTSVAAAPWRLGAQAVVTEIYTDNVQAAVDNRKQNDLVTEVKPGVSVSRQGARIGVDASYDFIGRYFLGDSGRNNINHNASTQGQVELVKKRLFVNASSRYSQRITDSTRNFNVNNLGATGNQSNVWSSTLGARWQSKLTRLARSQLQYNYNHTANDSTQLSNTDAHKFDVNLSNGPAFSRLSWQLGWAKSQSTTSRNTRNVDSQSLFAEVGYAFYRRARFSIRIGHEKNPRLIANSNNNQQKTNGTTQTALLSYQPTRRLSLNASYGRRSFGETYNASVAYQATRTSLQTSVGRGPFGDTYGGGINWQGRRTQVGINYTESLTTRSFVELQQQQSIFENDLIDPETGKKIFINTQFNQFDPNNPNDPNAFIEVLADGAFVRKRLQADASLRGRRNTITARASRERRLFEETSTQDSTYTADLGWKLALNKRANIDTNVNRQRINTAASNRSDDVWRLSTQYSHQLGKKAEVSLRYQYLLRDASDSSADFAENQIRASLKVSL